ncbi:MAG: hypothetical protein NVSMB12_03980 [Acidimicrobiales bacterium]
MALSPASMAQQQWGGGVLVGAASQAMVATDLQGRVTFWSSGAEQLYGYSADDAVGVVTRDLIMVEGSPSRARWEDVIEGRPWFGEHEVRTKDGTPFTVLLTLAPIRDGDGRVVGVLGTSIDALTSSSGATQGIQSRERIVGAVGSAAALLFCVDRQGVITTMEGHLAGRSDRSDAIGTDAFDRFQAQPAIQDGIRRALDGDDVDVLTARAGHDIEVRLRPRRDESGAVVDVVGVVTDVTTLVQAQRLVEASEERLQAVVEHAFDVAIIANADTGLTWVSPAATELFGYEPADMIGVNGLALVHPDDVARVAALLVELLKEPGASDAIEFRLRHADGSWRWVEEVITNRVDDPVVAGLIGNLRDITERKEAELALAESEARFRGHFERAVVGQAMTDVVGRFVEVNDAFCGITGYSASELLEMTIEDLTDPADFARERPVYKSLLEGAIPSIDMEKRFRRKDGEFVYVSQSASVLFDRDGRPQYVPAIVQDITERRRAERELARLALHDDLTGLANRTLLMDRLTRLRGSRPGHAGSTATLLIDLDEFKLVNDTYGHGAGDELLRQVAQRIIEVAGEPHTVARLGGDEFVVLCEDLDDDGQAIEMAERIREALTPPFLIESDEVFVSASIGIAATPGSAVDDLLRDADVAMYRAKDRGRARYEIFDDRLRTAAVSRLRVQNDLHVALSQGDLRVLYQPVLELRRGTVIGAEALVRWQHRSRGLLGPADFIEVAERSGLIVPIGEWVLRESCATAAHWPDATSTVAVNVSARQLGDPRLVDTVRAALADSGLAPSRLSLEITESALMEDPEAVLDTLIALKSLGVDLAIDDFGTGYSSLLYLKRFPVDALKIDRTFVDGLGVDPEDSAIVTSIVSLAAAVGIVAVAEGVETVVQLRELERLGCHYGQGYLWARPELAADVARRFGEVSEPQPG